MRSWKAALYESFERLERYEGKLSRTVLRGGCPGNRVFLPDTPLRSASDFD
jgi:hypothetical protein